MDTDEFVTATMRRVAASAVPPLRQAPAPAPARRWSAPLLVAAAAGLVALIVAVASLIGSQRSETGPATDATPTSPPATAACRLDYQPKPLPVWARGGFTPPDQPVAYVLGDRGDMAAIVWSTHHPLVASPSGRKANKILWVARVGPADGPLQIRATLTSTGKTVTRTVAPAPGPSSIDLPAAGCWSFDLRWGRHQDHLVLGFADR